MFSWRAPGRILEPPNSDLEVPRLDFGMRGLATEPCLRKTRFCSKMQLGPCKILSQTPSESRNVTWSLAVNFFSSNAFCNSILHLHASRGSPVFPGGLKLKPVLLSSWTENHNVVFKYLWHSQPKNVGTRFSGAMFLVIAFFHIPSIKLNILSQVSCLCRPV